MVGGGLENIQDPNDRIWYMLLPLHRGLEKNISQDSSERAWTRRRFGILCLTKPS